MEQEQGSLPFRPEAAERSFGSTLRQVTMNSAMFMVLVWSQLAPAFLVIERQCLPLAAQFQRLAWFRDTFPDGFVWGLRGVAFVAFMSRFLCSR